MTFVQMKRKELAIKVDRREMSRKEYDRQVAQAERVVEREEGRRNKAAKTVPAR